jgi:hypothetical protein
VTSGLDKLVDWMQCVLDHTPLEGSCHAHVHPPARSAEDIDAATGDIVAGPVGEISEVDELAVPVTVKRHPVSSCSTSVHVDNDHSRQQDLRQFGGRVQQVCERKFEDRELLAVHSHSVEADWRA